MDRSGRQLPFESPGTDGARQFELGTGSQRELVLTSTHTTQIVNPDCIGPCQRQYNGQPRVEILTAVVVGIDKLPIQIEFDIGIEGLAHEIDHYRLTGNPRKNKIVGVSFYSE